ncbi:MAG: leucine-rich repeat protein [Eubacteriales bacterium]|nr:leucine-rich repeat protein [Eubacteriales bacterium]
MRKLKHIFLCAIMVLLWMVLPGTAMVAHAENKEDSNILYEVKDVTDYEKSPQVEKKTTKDIKTMADDAIKDSGTLGSNVQWKLYENGLLEITGSGAMETNAFQSESSLTIEGIPWYSYASSIEEVKVGEGITYLGDASFYNCKRLTKVSLPSTLKTIGYWAFYECTMLENLEIPSSVTEIKLASFIDAPLKEIVIPDGVTVIEKYTFQGCKNLKKVHFPASLTTIQKSAFVECSGLKGLLLLPDTVTTIEDSAFSKTGYGAAYFGYRLSQLGSKIFNSVSSLKYVTFTSSCPTFSDTTFSGNTFTAYYPESITSWTEEKRTDYGGTITWKIYDGSSIANGDYGDNIHWSIDLNGMIILSGSGDLPTNSSSSSIPWYTIRNTIKKVVVTDGITSLNSFAFYGCENLEQVILADSVNKLSTSVFEGCISLKKVDFLNKVSDLGSSVFEDCSGLTSATIPDTVTSCSSYLFANCSSLQTVSLGSGINSFSTSTFNNCDKLTSISVSSENTSYSSVNGLLCNKAATTLIAIPKGLTEVIVPEGIKSIATYVIYSSKQLEKVSLPASLTSISSDNFTRCPKLSQIIVDPSNQSFVTHNNMLFNYGKTVLYAVTNQAVRLVASDFPSTMTTIRDDCFYYNDTLTSIEIPSSVTKISSYAFYYCESLENLKLSEGLKTIDYYAFYYCKSLKSISIPDSVTSLGVDAFYGCYKLNSITLGNGLTTLPNYVFSNCSSLNKIIIPATITNCGSSVFSSCSSLEDIVFLGDLPECPSKILSSSMKTKIYYPSDNTSWNEVEATKFGDAAILCPYSNGDYGSAIQQNHIVIPGGFSDVGCYDLGACDFSYTSSSTFFRQYVVKEAGGIYFLNGGKLLFLNESTGIMTTLSNFGSINACYEADGILYLAYSNHIYRYDLKKNTELNTITLNSVNDISAIGVDSQNRYYISYSLDSRYVVVLYDQEGNKLSQMYVPDRVYSFDGFDSTTGRFYMESMVNYYSWGYDHYGHGLTMGKTTGNTITYIDTSNSFLESGLISQSFDCIEYLCQNSAYLHQVSAEILDGRYMVTTSNLLNRVLLIDSNNYELKWSLDRKLDTQSLNNYYYDTTSVGVRALLNPKHDTIYVASNDSTIEEYDLKTKDNLYSYKTSHPVFALYSLGDYFIAIEKDGTNFYLEKISYKDPEQIQFTGNPTMKVGETQHLKINTGYRSLTSSDPSVASIDQAGNVAAWKAGTTTITLEATDHRTATFSIQVIGNSTSEVTDSNHKVSGTISNNISDNNYTVWSSPMNSYLTENTDGSYMRVEYIANTGVVIENYGTDWTLKSTKTLLPELPIFGGFYSGTDANYLVYGQKNESDSDDVEVIRIVKYSKTWNRISASSIKGANTYIPFDAGCVRMMETAGKLYLYTCHEMYAKSDGVHHQANMTFVVDESNMSILDSYYDVMNIAQAGYVSHSFNQFIQTDGTSVYRVDHGDAGPRAVSITKCAVDGKVSDVRYILAHKINGNSGANATGVSVGGFELSTTHCLVAGNSVDMTDSSNYSASGKRNIFLAIANKNLTKTSTVWLTDYDSSSNITVRTPQMVRLSSEHFLVMWEEYNTSSRFVTTKFVTVDAEGNKKSEHTSTRMRLSDCQPIVTSKGHVVWYVSDGNELKFHQLNPFDLRQGTTVDFTRCDVSLSLGADISTTITTPYTGNEIKPNVTVKDDTRVLSPSEEYDVTYENNINAGTAYVVITGQGEYKGIIRKPFIIAKIPQTLIVSPTMLNVVKDDSGTISVTGVGDITASSANSNILSINAGVSEDGKTIFTYKGLSTGSTTITIQATGDQNHDAASQTITAKVIPTATLIANAAINLSQTSYIYDGNLKQPNVTVIYGGQTLVINRDYLLSYDNNLKPGTANVTISGIGDYTGSVTKTFTISKASQTITSSPLTISVIKGNTGTFTVNAFGTITVSIQDTDILSMTKDSDGNGNAVFHYTGLAYGETTVTINASGDETHTAASKSITAHVIPSQTDMSSANVTLSQNSYVYDGNEKKPDVTVVYAGNTLIRDTHYTVTYSNCKNAGSAKATIEGIGQYTGSIEKTYTITPRSITNAQLIFLDIGPILEDGVFDIWGVVDGNTLLTKYTDYSSSSASSTYSGDYCSYLTVHLTGRGNYTGTVSQTIHPISSKAVLYSAKTGPTGTTLNWKKETGAVGYNIYRVKGSQITKLLTTNKNSITSWTDPEVKNYNAGYSYYIESYIITAQGMKISRPSDIVRTVALEKKTNVIRASNKALEYSPYSRNISVGASCSGGARLTYSTNNSNIAVNASGIITVNAKYVGSATITIQSAETSDYKAAIQRITVTVIPSKTTLASVSNVKGKKMLVKWKKNVSGGGYQIQYAKNSRFTSGLKTVNVTKNTVVKKTIAKLAKSKKYYVRIRTYKNVGGKTYYSNWSVTKAVKIKK